MKEKDNLANLSLNQFNNISSSFIKSSFLPGSLKEVSSVFDIIETSDIYKSIVSHINSSSDFVVDDSTPQLVVRNIKSINKLKELFSLSYIVGVKTKFGSPLPSFDNPIKGSFFGWSDKFSIFLFVENVGGLYSNTKIYGSPNKVEHYIKRVLQKRFQAYKPDTNMMAFDMYYLNHHDMNYSGCVVSIDEKFESYLYPNINRDLLFEGFVESKSPILILNGPSGTGKSVLAKIIANYIWDSRIAEYSKNIKDEVINLSNSKRYVNAIDTNPFYVKEKDILNQDRFWITVLLRKPPVLVLDDFDFLLTSREEGNEFMSKFLSYSDGVVSLKETKIIITTNFSEIKYDTALMRPGRLYNFVTLSALTPKQVSILITNLSISTHNFKKAMNIMGYNTKGNLTLAEIFEGIDFINSPLFKKGESMKKFRAPQTRKVGFSEK